MGQAVDHLILFSRYPVAGQAKTRLIPRLGAEKAALLQRRMTEMIVKRLTEAATMDYELRIYYHGSSRAVMEEWLGRCLFRQQADGDLGEKMLMAFSDSFAEGAKRVVIVGADCPGLSPQIVTRAFAKLKDHHLVLGPAEDGGYYLIGLTQSTPYLFSDMEWGGASLLEQTMERAAVHNLSTFLLESLADVDRPADLDTFDYHSLLE